MKLLSLPKTTMIFILFLGFHFVSFSQAEWNSVGNIGFTDTAGYQTIAINNSMPYVAFQDKVNGRKTSVMKFDGSNWVNVGQPGFSADRGDFQYLIFNDTVPYVVFKDFANGLKATVMKFDGTNWVNVGSPGFSDGEVFYTHMSFDRGTPFVVYTDRFNNDRATVKKFDGSNWISVGSTAFTPNKIYHPTIEFMDTVPYIAYRDAYKNYKASAMYYNGTSWDSLGNYGFSTGRALQPVMKISQDTVYVAYVDESLNFGVTVKKFDGTNWITVGFEGFSKGKAGGCDIAFSSNNIPHVVYRDDSLGKNTTVQKFESGNWSVVGSEALSTDTSGFQCIAFDGVIPYVAFKDFPNNKSTTVMNLRPEVSTYVYMNECSDTANIFGTIFTNDTIVSDTMFLSSLLGYDSITTVNLTISNAPQTYQNEIACDSIVINGTTYFTSQTVKNILTSSAMNGCDSIIITDLIINSTVQTTLDTAIIEGDNITVGFNTYNTSGTYHDTLSGSNGCDSVIATTLVVNPNNMKENKNYIKIYPNPVQNHLEVINIKNKSSISILDAEGRIIIKQHLSSKNNFIDVSFFESGLYFYQITSNTGALNQGKFIVQK